MTELKKLQKAEKVAIKKLEEALIAAGVVIGSDSQIVMWQALDKYCRAYCATQIEFNKETK